MIFIIGTGPMAIAHAQVLKELGEVFTVIGRGNSSAEKFANEIGVNPIIGGIENYLKSNQFSSTDKVIIATGTEALMPTLKLILLTGAGKVLIEKPSAISIEEVLENEDFLSPYTDKVYIAYNRRFYAAVEEALKLIHEDGGLTSMHFEFTEWAHKIEPLDKAPGVKENWFFANSTHVVDLAFFIGGKPKTWNAYSLPGQLNWHPKTVYSGAGITNKNVVFSYNANWESAGRWGIELLTFKRKIILKPLEEVQIQLKGSIQVEKHECDLSIDSKFKPGVFKQMQSFLDIVDSHSALLTLSQHISNCKEIYKKILS